MSSDPTILDVDDQRAVSDAGMVRERLRRPLTLCLLAGVLAVLMFGPLAFGGVEPWAIFTIEASTALLLLLWTIAASVSPLGLKVRLSPLYKPMLLILAVGMLQLAIGRSVYPYDSIMAIVLIGSNHPTHAPPSPSSASSAGSLDHSLHEPS